ncbi:hypothetical protein ACFCXS_00830 [Streptomyces sp. NPDC056373]|uniref:hypothetical protein n=1 Tax=Streptomyces sp. NPDC056373 TaxID=3345798 RepID=UPI0035D90347
MSFTVERLGDMQRALEAKCSRVGRQPLAYRGPEGQQAGAKNEKEGDGSEAVTA